MNDGRFGMIAVLIVTGVVGVVGVIGVNVYAATHTGEVTITVEGKERGGDEKPALVFTDSETYQVSDSILDGHFSSSDTYGRLKEGKTYKCEYRGVRIPLFSMWKNLTSCKQM